MAGTHHGEVSVVERGELRLVESLNNREYGCVYKADVGVWVLVHNFVYSKVIVRLQFSHLVITRDDVMKKAHQDTDIHSLRNEVINFNEHWRRNHHWFRERLNQLSTAEVIPLTTIERCE